MHFLRKSEVHGRSLEMPRACVTVRVVKDTLVIESGSLGVLKIGAQMAPVPERMKVVTDDGKVVKPSKGKQFWVTVETFDPMHAVMEAAPEDFY
jgi:hypothetical protein